MTKEEFVSIIINDVRALNKDDHISRRYILHKGLALAKHYMSLKLGDKTLDKEDSLTRTLHCFPLKEVDVVTCDGIVLPRCGKLMKSKKKLPELFYSRYGSSILRVSTIDNSETFYPTNVRSYMRDRKRVFFSKSKKKYYYVVDNYLYLPDVSVEAVNVVVIPAHEEEVVEINEGKEASLDKRMWDNEFMCSDKLLRVVLEETRAAVLNSLRGFPIDENPNLTEHQKDKTVV